MYIETITVENFKAIEKMEIELKPGINLLIGDNGVGKTSILEAITVSLGAYLSGIKGVSSKNILMDDIRISMNYMGDASSAIEYKLPVSVGCCLNVDGHKYSWTRSRESEDGSSRTKLDNKEIRSYAQSSTNDMKKVLPLLSFQSEARVWQTKRGDFGTALTKKLNDRRCGYIGCLDYSLDTKSIKEWCLKMELEAFQRKQEISEYEAFKNMIASVMQSMSELDEKPQIYYSHSVGDIVYLENGVAMPISYLSAGYQSVLWMMMDIAYRLVLLNPGISDVSTVPGIVLIDELDMHLHPKWQWNILKILKETFPEVQFIIATHSPIVISSCENGNLVCIDEKQQVSYLPNAYGYSVKDVLELRQGSSALPKDIVACMDEFDKYLDAEDYDNAKEILQKMRAEYGENHSEVKKATAELEWDEFFGADKE